MLLQDNNVKFKKRQYKRLKKAQREQGNGQGESSDDEFDSRGGTRRSAEDKIKDRLFDDVDVDGRFSVPSDTIMLTVGT